jgi:hypothetical protein
VSASGIAFAPPDIAGRLRSGTISGAVAVAQQALPQRREAAAHAR